MSIVASSTTNCSNAQSKAISSITAVLKFEPLRHLTRLHVLVIKERKLANTTSTQFINFSRKYLTI